MEGIIISIEIRNELLRELKNRLLRINKDISIENKGDKSREYKPYVLKVEDNLIVDSEIKSKFLLENYSNLEKEDLKAIRSSAALTYNTFINIVDQKNLVYKENVYNSFMPEVQHRPLKQGGNARIDAFLRSKDNKALIMIEMKMIEHYDSGISFKSEPYLSKDRYTSQLNEEEINVFINLFTEIEKLINDKKFIHYDIQQMAKHLLSIINNRKTKNYFADSQKIELLSVSWLASRTKILEKSDFKKHITSIDDAIEKEARIAMSMLNKVLEKLNIANIEVIFMDYSTFTTKTNLDNKSQYNYLNERYL